MAGLVGQNRIDITIAQAHLVKAHIFVQILKIKDVFLGMIQLIPAAVVTYLLLVLLAQCLSVQTVPNGKSGYADRSALNLPLLKKRQTRR